jgi:hypothetical protein
MHKITRETFMIYRACSCHFMRVGLFYEEKYLHRVPLFPPSFPPRLSAYLKILVAF